MRSKSGTLTSLPSIGPSCPEAFCLREKKLSTKLRKRKKACLEAPCGAVVPSVFPPMGNWATIWTSGNRGAQAPKPDPITEPETTHPNIAARQTSRRQGKPRAELFRTTTTTSTSKIGYGDFVVDNMIDCRPPCLVLLRRVDEICVL